MRKYNCIDTEEVVYNYKDYLKTDHWKNIKKRYRKSKLIQNCYICGSQNNLNLHHKSYKRIGKERLNDLIPLCRECHYFTHQALKKANSINLNLWNIARRVKKSKKGKYSLKTLKREHPYISKSNNKKWK